LIHGQHNVRVFEEAFTTNFVQAGTPQLALNPDLHVEHSDPDPYQSGQEQNYPPLPLNPCNQNLQVPRNDDWYATSTSSASIQGSSRSSNPVAAGHFHDGIFSSISAGGADMSGLSAEIAEKSDPCFPPTPEVCLSHTGNAEALTSTVLGHEPPFTNGTVTDEQMSIFHRYQTKWKSEHRFPRDDEINALAILESLDPAAVRTWLVANFHQDPASNPTASQIPQDAFQTIPQSVDSDIAHMTLRGIVQGEPQVIQQDRPQAIPQGVPQGVSQRLSQALQDVERLAARKNHSPCGESAQARQGPPNQVFKCPHCPFSSDKYDNFKRHVQTKYPQDFWHCQPCRQRGINNFVCHRADKIAKHLRDAHGLTGEDNATAKERSKVDFSAYFPTECPYWDGVRQCAQPLNSWVEYITHLKNHCLDRIPNGPWELRDRPDADDRDQPGSDNGGSSGANASSGLFPGGSQSRYGGQSEPSYSFSGYSQYANHSPGGCMHAQLEIQSLQDKCYAISSPDTISLVDTLHRRVVHKPLNAKYLALDYTMALDHCPHLKHFIMWTRASKKCARLPKSVGDLLKQAIAMTKDMGYQYIWIDILCGLQIDEGKRSGVYEQATSIIYTRGHKPEDDSMNFLICHSRTLQTVRSWTENTKSVVSFSHVHDLGRGSFGTVDKVKLTSGDQVKLTSTQEVFARKRFTKWRVGDPDQSAHLQEIELLQKFDHPNIARFVAAYIEEQALNVVMEPVADCDLKRYLLQPSKWPERRSSIANWYLSLASAVEHMHEKCQFRHGDLKPENILIFNNDVHIADLGFAQPLIKHQDLGLVQRSAATTRHATDTPKRIMLTPKYSPPGALSGRTPTHKSDIFSLGCVFLEMITIQHGRTLEELNAFILQMSPNAEKCVIYCRHINRLRMWLQGFAKQQLEAYDWTAIRLCYRMLDPDPKERPNATEISRILKEQYTTLATTLQSARVVAPKTSPRLEAAVAHPLTSCREAACYIGVWRHPKSCMNVAERMLAKSCAVVVNYVHNDSKQVKSARKIFSPTTLPTLCVDGTSVAIPELMHHFLRGFALTFATASVMYPTPVQEQRKRWQRAFRRLRLVVRTPLKASVRIGCGDSTRASVSDKNFAVDAQEATHSLDLDIPEPLEVSMTLEDEVSPLEIFQPAQKTLAFQKIQLVRKRATSLQSDFKLGEKPPAKKTMTYTYNIDWGDVDPPKPKPDSTHHNQNVAVFERRDPVLINRCYHSGSQYAT
jgi:serine/threonine protein kinase